MLADDGTVKLVEFGCSSIPLPDGDARHNLFRPPEFLATQESLSAQDFTTLAKSDVWSLGVLLVVMTTGVAPLAHDRELVESPSDEFWLGAETQSGEKYSSDLKGRLI